MEYVPGSANPLSNRLTAERSQLCVTHTLMHSGGPAHSHNTCPRLSPGAVASGGGGSPRRRPRDRNECPPDPGKKKIKIYYGYVLIKSFTHSLANVPFFPLAQTMSQDYIKSSKSRRKKKKRGKRAIIVPFIGHNLGCKERHTDPRHNLITLCAPPLSPVSSFPGREREAGAGTGR